MPRQTILSWNIQGQNPLNSEFAQTLSRLIDALPEPPDWVCLCEVGETVLYEMFAHDWIILQAELDAIAPFFLRLDEENKERFRKLTSLINLETRYNSGVPGWFPPTLFAGHLEEPITSDIGRERYRQIAKGLRQSYFSAAIGVRDVHALIRREMRLLKLELRMIGANANWAESLTAREVEKHPLLTRYRWYIQLVPQENRHYLILSKAPVAVRAVVDLGGKRPLLCLGGNPNLWYIHAIANKHPAKRQILDTIGRMIAGAEPVVFTGDLNKHRPDLIEEEAGNRQLGLVDVAGCGQATQQRGNELDYAVGYGLVSLEVQLINVVDSDHYPILVIVETA